MIFQQEWEARYVDGENTSAFFPAEVPGNVQRDCA